VSEQHYKLLIVDDDDNVRHALARWFWLKGYQVEQASDGIEAIERASKEGFDLISLDLEMPRMGGIEALAQLRVLQPSTPVVILTGYARSTEDILSAGASKVVMKPLRLAQFEEEVRALLQRGGELSPTSS